MAKRTKLDYNMEELTQNLRQSTGQGVNAFFSPPSPAALDKKSKEKAQPKTEKRNVSPSSPLPTASSPKTDKPIDTPPEKMVQTSQDAMTSRSRDITTDVMRVLFQDINKKLWREMIEETETHNSSLRMSAKERDQIEDVVRDLKRKYKIKTSMNEIARLGLLLLIHDFKKRGTRSIINEVKTS